MARSCIHGCWRIQAILTSVYSTRLPLVGRIIIGPSPNIPFDVDAILDISEASYGCSGPRTELFQIEKGMFKKRIVTEEVPMCGLPDSRFS